MRIRPGILAAVTSTRRRYIKPIIDPFPGLKIAMNKYWYPFITRRWTKDDVVFLNWGYEEDPPLGLPLAPEDDRPTGTASSFTTARRPKRISVANKYSRSAPATAAEPRILSGRCTRPLTPVWTTTRTVSHSPTKTSTYRGWSSCTATPKACPLPMSPSTR